LTSLGFASLRANRPAADWVAELQHVPIDFARLRLAARDRFAIACRDDPDGQVA